MGRKGKFGCDRKRSSRRKASCTTSRGALALALASMQPEDADAPEATKHCKVCRYATYPLHLRWNCTRHRRLWYGHGRDVGLKDGEPTMGKKPSFKGQHSRRCVRLTDPLPKSRPRKRASAIQSLEVGPALQQPTTIRACMHACIRARVSEMYIYRLLQWWQKCKNATDNHGACSPLPTKLGP